jgi:hypothetical protein
MTSDAQTAVLQYLSCVLRIQGIPVRIPAGNPAILRLLLVLLSHCTSKQVLAASPYMRENAPFVVIGAATCYYKIQDITHAPTQRR